MARKKSVAAAAIVPTASRPTISSSTTAPITASSKRRVPTPFQLRVYAACKQIPAGYVSTYKHISDHLKSAPRAVGQALRHNPYAPVVPCHRVISTDHFIAGFYGQWGAGPNIDRKKDILRREGLAFGSDGKLVTKSSNVDPIFTGFVALNDKQLATFQTEMEGHVEHNLAALSSNNDNNTLACAC